MKDGARVYSLPRIPVNPINEHFKTTSLITIVAMAPWDPSDSNNNKYKLDPESWQVQYMLS